MNSSELVEEALAQMQALPKPITPARLRRFTLSRFNSNEVREWVPSHPAAWESLSIAAEALRHKDRIAGAAGSFLHIAIPIVRDMKMLKRVTNDWQFHPAQCCLCYRISGAQKACSVHSRLQNEAGYRRGKRVKPIFDNIWLAERTMRRAVPAIPIDPSPLSAWLSEYAPTIKPKHDSDLLDLLAALDDSEPTDYITELRKIEHRRMAGIEQRPSSKSPTSTDFAKAFVLMADAYNRAEQKMRRGNRGGKRPGAGRPRKLQ